MLSFKDILCKLNIHDWIDSDDYNNRSVGAKFCKNCYLKIYDRATYKMKRKNGATKEDRRDIKLTDLLKKRK